MKHKQKIILSAGAAVVIVILALGVFLAASNRKNAAQKHTDLLFSEIKVGSLSVTKSNTDCINTGNGVVKTVFRHRACVSSKYAYFLTSGNQSDVEKSLYDNVTRNGWSLLDSNRGDDYSFFGGYLDAITNINGIESSLAIRLLSSDKIGQLNELSSSERAGLQARANSWKYIVAVYVTSRYEG
jgi:hypothetical protein